MKQTWLTLLVAMGCFLFIGCGEKRPDGMPKLYPVTLVISQEGQPLAQASVSAIPESGFAQFSSGGVTDDSGTVVLFTHGQYKGMPLGKYKVTVQKTIVEDPQKSEADPSPTKIFDVVAAECSSREKTPLSFEVTAGTNQFDLNAGKPVRIKK